MSYAVRAADGSWQEIVADLIVGEVRYPFSTLALLSDDERLALDVAEIVEALNPPASDDIRTTGTEIVDADGTPTRRYTVEALSASEVRALREAAVEAERDRRIVVGFVFAGKLFQSRPEDQKRISGAFSLALAAVITGAQPGDLLWHKPADGVTPFGFIAADNSVMPMDAQTVMAFGTTAARWESAHIFAARALKDLDPIPADYADDNHWPS